jgi:sortase (surface protein transpeptidase)
VPPSEPVTPSPVVPAPVPGSAPPVHVAIPALGVDAPVAPVADTHTGIAVPEDVSTVGWWVAGAAPEDPSGTTVLVGHVDAWDQGPGALYHLDRARAGTPVEVTTGDGQVGRWAVTSLQVVRKASGLPSSLFAQGTDRRLVLITCGGPFDGRTRSYLDDIVVTAEPVP